MQQSRLRHRGRPNRTPYLRPAPGRRAGPGSQRPAGLRRGGARRPRRWRPPAPTRRARRPARRRRDSAKTSRPAACRRSRRERQGHTRRSTQPLPEPRGADWTIAPDRWSRRAHFAATCSAATKGAAYIARLWYSPRKCSSPLSAMTDMPRSADGLVQPARGPMGSRLAPRAPPGGGEPPANEACADPRGDHRRRPGKHLAPHGRVRDKQGPFVQRAWRSASFFLNSSPRPGPRHVRFDVPVLRHGGAVEQHVLDANMIVETIRDGGGPGWADAG